MQKLVFPMRETMPHFICSLRQVDEWKRFQARQSQVLTQAAYDVNAKYIKNPFAKSLKIEDLLRFLDDTVLDIDFMVQLPSIEKCLDQWWKVYAVLPPPSVSSQEPTTTQCNASTSWIDQETLRQVYYDLANVLVQAKTENIHKNSVSMIMRASWTKWSTKEPPLIQAEFYRLLFVLAHLMTESNRLGDYVTFFQETLAKINRVSQSKAKRTESRKRKPRIHRKSSVSTASRSSKSISSLGRRSSMSRSESLTGTGDSERFFDSGASTSSRGIVNVSVRRVLTTQPTGLNELGLDDGDGDGYGGDGDDSRCADQFVEVLDRRHAPHGRLGAAQHVVVDPLLLDRHFQGKWKKPANAKSLSIEDTLRKLHPLTNKYVPPLCIARLHTSPTAVAGATPVMRQCHSTPALTLKTVSGRGHEEQQQHQQQQRVLPVVHGPTSVDDQHDDEALRRSLSMVSLKKRIHHNKSHNSVSTGRGGPDGKDHERREKANKPEPIYLAIST